MIKWGFEFGPGGNKGGSGEFINRLTAAGIPFTFKGTDDAGLLFQAQQNGHPDSVLIYRVSTAGQNNGVQYDVPIYTLPPLQAAQHHLQITAAKWPPELLPARVWSECVNEVRAKVDPDKPMWGGLHPMDWMGHFMTEYAILANGIGIKVCGPAFNSGEPEPVDYSQPGMLDWLKYCATFPHMAALSCHEYSFDLLPYANSYPWRYGRFQAAIAAADLAGIPRTFKIFITEFGWTLNNVPDWQTAVNTIQAYSQLSTRFPQLEAVAIWSLRSGWGNIDNELVQWIADNGNPFANWIIGNQYPNMTQPQATAVEFGGTLPKEEPEEPPDGGGGTVTKYKYLGVITSEPLTDKKVPEFEQPVSATHERILFHDVDENGKLVFISATDYIPVPPNAKRVSLGHYHGYEEEPVNPNPPPPILTLPAGARGVDLSNYQAGFFDLVDPGDFDFYIFRCSDGMNTSATSNNHDANGVDKSLWKFADVGHASMRPWGIYHFLRPGNVQGQIDKVLGIYQQLVARGTPPRKAMFADGRPFAEIWPDVEDWSLSIEMVKQFNDGIEAG